MCIQNKKGLLGTVGFIGFAAELSFSVASAAAERVRPTRVSENRGQTKRTLHRQCCRTAGIKLQADTVF